jgi:hypothetical protein
MAHKKHHHKLEKLHKKHEHEMKKMHDGHRKEMAKLMDSSMVSGAEKGGRQSKAYHKKMTKNEGSPDRAYKGKLVDTKHYAKKIKY